MYTNHRSFRRRLRTTVSVQSRRDSTYLSTEKARSRRHKSNGAKEKAHLSDIDELAPSQLRKKYNSTASCHRNMLAREKAGKAKVSPEFRRFADFLRHMGPRPGRTYTVDRIDNSKPIYGADNCRWADKRTQARNRSTTIMLTDGGTTLPLTTWAERTKQSPDTLRNRRRKGWSDQEIIHGKSTVVLSKSGPDIFDRLADGNHKRAQILRSAFFDDFNDLHPKKAISAFLEWLADGLLQANSERQRELEHVIRESFDAYIDPDDPYYPPENAKIMESLGKRERRLKQRMRRNTGCLKRVRREQAIRQKIISAGASNKDDE